VSTLVIEIILPQILYVQAGSVNVEWVLGVNFVKTPTGVEKYLPYMVDVSSPLLETSFDIQLVTIGND
jgi:hypothetical protein